MLRSLRTLSMRMSSSKNFLVMDGGLMDLSFYDFPQECLDKDVSYKIKKKYLSLSEQPEEDILKQTIYKGVIMGRYTRLFVSIPTKHPIVNKYYNVHYLIDTGSPITTLTQRALSTIHQKEYHSDSLYFLDQLYQIGSQKVQIHCSNRDKKCESLPFHNVNVLGLDFFEKFKQVILNQNFQDRELILDLRKVLKTEKII